MHQSALCGNPDTLQFEATRMFFFCPIHRKEKCRDLLGWEGKKGGGQSFTEEEIDRWGKRKKRKAKKNGFVPKSIWIYHLKFSLDRQREKKILPRKFVGERKIEVFFGIIFGGETQVPIFFPSSVGRRKKEKCSLFSIEDGEKRKKWDNDGSALLSLSFPTVLFP